MNTQPSARLPGNDAINAWADGAFEKDHTYLEASAFRFVDDLPPQELTTLWSRLHSDKLPVEVHRQQREMMLMETPIPFRASRKRTSQRSRDNDRP